VCDTGAIWQLEDHLKACINSRDYGAAQHVEAQLVELKQQQERHALEVGYCSASHLLQQLCFNWCWHSQVQIDGGFIDKF
jgi:hypothetical protein